MPLMAVLVVLVALPNGERMQSVPFEADFEEVLVIRHPGGTRTEDRQLSRLFRDSQGRLRQEYILAGPNGELVAAAATLTDFSTGRFRVIDLKAGGLLGQLRLPRNAAELTEVASSTRMALTASSTSPSGQRAKEEDLGERDIEGLRARGSRTKEANTVTEVWTALRIDQPNLLLRITSPDREQVKRLFNIRFQEPDPALFAPLESP